MKFDLPKENANIIKVLGVGGGGSNAVNHMFQQGINGVDFLVCNTDQQALDVSPVPLKIQLGSTLTEGRGAGSIAEVGKNAAIENIDEIKDLLSTNTKMVFITAGMGGGTGTGAAPVIAKTAREMGVLTVGIVTMPFFFEGKKRREQAEQGIKDIRENVDTLLIINNEKLREMCGNLAIAKAFAMADDVLTTAAKGIAEIITRTGYINVDFEDVRTVMSESGVAIMGSAESEGEDRAIQAVEKALASPLLNDNNIEGARYVLLNIAFGNQEVLMDEISDITDYIQEEAGSTADVIWGYGMDESLGDSLSVTIIATGFKSNPNTGVNLERKPEARKMNLEEPEKSEATSPEPPRAENEPFLLERKENQTEPEEETSSEKQVPAQAHIEFEITRHHLDEDDSAQKSEESEENEDVDEPYLSSQEGDSSDFEELSQESATDDQESMDSDLVGSVEEPEDETPEDSSTRFTLSGSIEDSEPDSSASKDPHQEEEQKEWEPFMRSEEKEKNSEPKRIVDEKPSFKTTTPAAESSSEPNDTTREEQSKRASDRLSRLRDLSMKLRTPSGMSDLENEPAFKRKQINLDDVPNSSESNASRFSLNEEENEDGEKKTKLRPNNPFLHDNVD
ncbi:MAG: cell division protein FtsZ [Salibacteraceae bacterium]